VLGQRLKVGSRLHTSWPGWPGGPGEQRTATLHRSTRRTDGQTAQQHSNKGEIRALHPYWPSGGAPPLPTSPEPPVLLRGPAGLGPGSPARLITTLT
jgi:hypothetical protein